jgi:hypothetical protein
MPAETVENNARLSGQIKVGDGLVARMPES